MVNEVVRGGPRSYRQKTNVRAYQAVSDSYHEFALKQSSKKWWDLFLHHLRHRARVLDIGCGTGVAARYLSDRSRGLRMLGIDVSPKMIASARICCPAARFQIKAIETAEFSAGSFDGIMAFFSLLHLPKAQTKKVIANAYRWLSPGGVLAIAVVEGKGEGICENFMGKGVPVYLSYYQKAELRDMLESVGFEIIDTRELRVETEGFDETELFFLAKKPLI